MIEFSSVTTSFNDEKKIIRYFDDVFSQTSRPREIIVADGGSKDNTIEVIKEYADKHPDIPIKVLSGKRLNIAQGFNEAIKAATTDFVIVGGIGNIIDAKCYEYLIHDMEEGDVDFVYPVICGVDNTDFSKSYNKVFLNENQGIDNRVSLNHCVLAKKSAYEELGYYYENFIYAGEDTEFFLRAYGKGFTSRCNKQAVIWWETPKNFKEFLKQIKVYTIGNMQIQTQHEFWNEKKVLLQRLLVVLVALALGIFSGFANNIIYLVPVILVVAWNSAKKFLKFKGKSYVLSVVNNYMPIYYGVKYCQYLTNEKYKVHREN